MGLRIFRRRVLVPAVDGVPADLPPWARDELVRRRLEMADLTRENMLLRAELTRARGGDVAAALREMMGEGRSGGVERQL